MLAPRSAQFASARLFACLLPVLVAVACDKAPLTAPTDSEVVLFASSTVVALNGTVEITANVLEPGGIPVQNGTQVNFVTTLGTLEPAEARTSGGRATVRLNAGGLSGIARVNAYTGGASAEPLEVRIGASAATRISLNASPGSLPQNGGTAEILAVVTDDENRRLEGVPVSFSATTGTLRDRTVVTDRFGEARTTLTATRESTVTATVGSVTETFVVRVTTAPNITISGPTTAIGVGETANFTVGVQVGANGDPISAVSIDFGDGTSENLGPVTSSRTVSHVYSRAGTYRVEVTVRDTAGVIDRQAMTVTVEQRSIAVNISASPSSTPRINTPVQFAATATSSGTSPITGYFWDFGDGTTRFSTGPNTSHSYGSTGRRVVSVEVTNAAGQRGSNTTEIVVLP